jgi:hypothetical protein
MPENAPQDQGASWALARQGSRPRKKQRCWTLPRRLTGPGGEVSAAELVEAAIGVGR